MDSSLHGAPLSAIQMAPKVAAPSCNTVSGIRAPLTVDESDFEYSVSSKSRRNSATSSYYSGSELEYEGFVSGEDESGTSSGRHFDEEVLEETQFVEEYEFSKGCIVQETSHKVDGNGFSRSFGQSPDERFGRRSGSFSGNAFLRPFVRIPDERIYKGISNVNDSSDSGDEDVENEDYVVDKGNSRPIVVVRDEDVSDNEVTPVINIKFPLVKKLSVPIAQISGDSDHESQGSEPLEEEGYSGIVRIPSIEVLQRVSSAPKVRMLENDEGNDDESRDENMVFSDGVLSCKDEIEHIGVEGTMHSVISADKIQDKEAGDDSFVVNEEYNSVQSGDLMHLGEEIQEIDVTNDHREPTDLAEGTVYLGNISSVDFVEEPECPLGSIEALDDEDAKSSSARLEDNLVFNNHTESEKLKSESEQAIDQNIELPSSVYQCLYIKETTVEGFAKFPESPTESMHIDTSDSVLKDAGSIGVSFTTKSLVEDAKMDQEMEKESENSVHLPVKAAEIDRGEILIDHSQEIDDQIVMCLDESFNEEHGISDCTENCSLESDLADPSSTGPIVKARNHDHFVPSSTNGELEEVLSESEEKIEKIQHIREKYLRLLHRLGHSPEDSIASKVLYELSQMFDFDSARKAATELETQTKSDLEISLSILVIGKTGVGKSATINSIFREKETEINAFEPGTTRTKEIIDTIDGFKVKVVDTPGLRTSPKDESINRKLLSSIKKLMQKSNPDVVLYVDRLDAQTGDLNDLPLLRLVTTCLGPSIWRKSIVVLTHASSVPPDGPNGYPLSYEVLVAQKSLTIRQLINFSSGKLLEDPGSMIPMNLVENHPFAETNRENWRLRLLFLCCSVKTLSELSSLVKVQSPLNQGSPFGLKIRSHFLSSFLQSKNVDSDAELGYLSDSDKQGYSSHLLTRPVFNSCGWDHDCNYDNVLIEDKFGVSSRLPAVISVQLTKNKKDFHIQLHSSVRSKHGDNRSRVSVRGGWNNKLSGQICIKTSCSDQLQIAALVFLPIAKAIFKKIFPQPAMD